MSIPFPTLRQLQFFVALARRKSFSKAAEDCFVSQSTLSAAVKELEGILGGALVDRTTRKFALTARGERVLSRAQELLMKTEALVRDAHEVEPMSGPFRLGIIPTIAPFLVPSAVPAIKLAFPKLQLRLREGLTGDLLDDLMTGAIDAAVLAFPYEAPGVEHVEIGEDPFFVVCHEDNPLAAQETISLDDLPADQLLLLEDGHCLREHALQACRLRAPEIAGAYGATSLFTLFQMVASDMGVTLAPKIALDCGAATAPGLVTRPFAKPVPFRTIGVAWREGSSRAEEAVALAEVLKPAFAAGD